jgi:beta-lactamase class D
LKISASEQARVLARLALDQLPFPPETQAAVRDIVKLEEGPGWTLYGKTGTADKNDPDLGWRAGWIEKNGRVYGFALNIDLDRPEDSAKRVDLVRASLKALGLLEEEGSSSSSFPGPTGQTGVTAR